MSNPATPSPYLWGAPLEERLAALDAAIALLRQADDQALQLLGAVRRLAHLVDWRASAADAFRSAVSAWEGEALRLSMSIQSTLAQVQSDRSWLQTTG